MKSSWHLPSGVIVLFFVVTQITGFLLAAFFGIDGALLFTLTAGPASAGGGWWCRRFWGHCSPRPSELLFWHFFSFPESLRFSVPGSATSPTPGRHR